MESLSTGSLVEWGVATSPLGGQSITGDKYLVQPYEDGILFAVADGLGHGPEAAAAASAALDPLAACPHCSVVELVERCHQASRQTRGAAMSLASFHAAEQTMTWIGIGDVAGLLVHANPEANPAQHSLPLRAGVVGYKLPSLMATDLQIQPGDTLILTTDGIDREFTSSLRVAMQPQRLAMHILTEHGKKTDDLLVLVARWIGNNQTETARK